MLFLNLHEPLAALMDIFNYFVMRAMKIIQTYFFFSGIRKAEDILNWLCDRNSNIISDVYT